MAIVPAPDFSTAIDNAWACGCNPGGMVGGAMIVRGLADWARVPTCVLLAGAAGQDALGAAYSDDRQQPGHENGPLPAAQPPGMVRPLEPTWANAAARWSG